MNGQGENRDRADLIVIGGGLAGLTAAALVARAGRSVVVLERGHQPGGRASTHIRNGVHFNLGPHALYCQGHAYRLLNDLGISLSGHLPSPGEAVLISADRLHRLPLSAAGLTLSRLLTIREKWRLLRFLMTLAQRDTRSLDRTPLNEWIGRYAGHGRLAGLLRSLIRVSTYADDHDQLSAGAAINQLKLALAGNVHYLDGGWQTIINGLRDRSLEHGAEIRSASRVSTVGTDDEGVIVRLTCGGELRGRAAILAIDPEATRELLSLEDDDPLARQIGELQPVRASCLDLALDHLPRPEHRFALDMDRSLYYSVHSAAARLAPDGLAVVHVMKYLGDSTITNDAIERELEGLLDHIQLGWREHVRQRRFMPGMIVSHALPAAQTGGLAGRPDSIVAGRAGVFLAGDWIGPEGMLADASAASAERAASLALAALDRADTRPGRSPTHVAC